MTPETEERVRGAAGWRVAGWFCFYGIIAVVLFHRLLPHLASGFPHDAGDPVLSAWALWWNVHHVPFTAGWWDGLAFYPEHGSLAFSDHRVGLGLIASPVLWLGGGPILAHNVVFLLSFPLCAICAHVLARDVTGSDLAAVIAGLTYGFNPYRMDHLPHLELLAAWWLPLALLALHRYLRDSRVRWLVAFAVALALQGLSCGYYFFFAVPLVGAWILWFVRPMRRIVPIAIAWAASVAPLLPALLGYSHFLGRLNLHRDYDEIRVFSADITGLFSSSPLLAVWHPSPLLHRPEGDVFVGVFAVAVTAGAILLSLSRSRPIATRWRPVQVLCLVAAVVFEAVALSGVAHGWHLRVFGVSIAAHDAARPATTAAALLAIATLASPSVASAFRRRSLLAFYAGAAVLMWLFTLGPVPLFLGERALFRGPYAYLMALPGFDRAFRVPARFAMLAALALSMAAALAFARITSRSRKAVRTVFGVGLAAGIVLDGWTFVPVAPAPERWQWPAEIRDAAAVLELPMAGDADEIAAVWRSIGHGKRLVNGYSGYDPPHHRLLRRALERHDPSVLGGLAEYGPILVAFDPQHVDANFWRQALAGAGAAATKQPDARRAFAMLPRTGPVARPSGAPVPIVSGSANAGRFVLEDVTDANPATRWVSNRFQRGDEQVVLALDGPHRLTGVVLSMGPFGEEYPRRLRIETSRDGETWSVATDQLTAGLAFTAILHDALRTELAFSLPDVESRYVRLRQIGADAEAYWAFCDVAVIGH